MPALTPDALAGAAPTARRRDRVFYTGMALAVAAAVLIGFARTFYLRSHFEPTPLAAVFELHGIVFSAWIALFVAQASLIAARRTATHRRLGWVGAGLAVTMVAVAVAAAIASGRRDIAAGYEVEALIFFSTPILSMAVFASLVAAAIAFRAQPETHKRLMLFATIGILDAAIARWPIAGLSSSPFAYYVVTDAFILAALAYDFVSRRRVAAAYVYGGLLIVAGQWLREPLGATAVWQAFARAILA